MGTCRYFAPAGAEDALRGSTLRTVRFALGPQFGTLSLGAAVLTVIQIMRQALQQCVPPPVCRLLLHADISDSTVVRGCTGYST